MFICKEIVYWNKRNYKVSLYHWPSQSQCLLLESHLNKGESSQIIRKQITWVSIDFRPTYWNHGVFFSLLKFGISASCRGAQGWWNNMENVIRRDKSYNVQSCKEVFCKVTKTQVIFQLGLFFSVYHDLGNWTWQLEIELGRSPFAVWTTVAWIHSSYRK